MRIEEIWKRADFEAQTAGVTIPVFQNGFIRGVKWGFQRPEVLALSTICEMIAEPRNHGFNFSGEIMLIVPDKAKEALLNYRKSTGELFKNAKQK